jgi:hypothetical protein
LRTAVDLGRRFHVERLVRLLFIELARKIIEARLMLQEVHSGRSGRLLFQGRMHALMASVLLRAAGLEALDGGAEPRARTSRFAM